MELNLEQKILIKSGTINKIGATEFAILLVINAHTDIQGVAFPSQQTIADLTGLSVSTVHRALKKLEDRKLIQREQMGFKGLTIYSVKTSDQTATQQIGQEAPVEPVRKYTTAKDFIEQFCKQYSNHYGVNYSPNWARDGSLIKAKLLNNYTDEQLDFLLIYTFEQFDKKYANKRFPRPSIGALTSFIVNDAMAEQLKEQTKQIKLVEAEEMDLDKFFKNQDF